MFPDYVPLGTVVILGNLSEVKNFAINAFFRCHLCIYPCQKDLQSIEHHLTVVPSSTVRDGNLAIANGRKSTDPEIRVCKNFINNNKTIKVYL